MKRYYHPILFCMFFTSLFELFRRAFLLTGRELSISNRPLIVFSPDSGLGNNMIALVSSKFLAEIVQSPFAIVWESSSTLACQAAYTAAAGKPPGETDPASNLPGARCSVPEAPLDTAATTRASPAARKHCSRRSSQRSTGLHESEPG